MDDFVTKAHCLQTRERDILQLRENTQRLDDLTRRVGETEKTHKVIQEMGRNIATMVVHLENFQKELKNQGERLSSLEEVPKMRWNAVIQAIISVVIGSVLTLGIQNILVR